MNIVLLGSGGREHALAAHLFPSTANSGKLYAAPANPGILQYAVPAGLTTTRHEEVIAFCIEHAIDLVVIGPEAPLAAGLADELRTNNIAVFGPSKAAAQLESSKGFAKEFMARYAIPTAQFRRFSAGEYKAAQEYVSHHSLPVVIKADGLAAGKGVVIAETQEEAQRTLTEMLDGKFGAASTSIVVEEFMQGEEASVFAITDGERFLTLAPAQDHKRIGTGDVGENTGGMGAYCPAPIVTESVMQQVHERIIAPTLNGMKHEGMPFVGCLYAGLMIHNGTAKVVEFNARFGDPETQAVLSVFEGDLAALLLSAAQGQLRPETVRSTTSGAACCVVLAAKGYPGEYQTNERIEGITEAEAVEGVRVYHAGTKLQDGALVTNGGRVLGVTSKAATLREAIQRSYEAVERISFAGKTFRTDIGAKGLR
jgi:phosphoribosylamine--glycine ligase